MCRARAVGRSHSPHLWDAGRARLVVDRDVGGAEREWSERPAAHGNVNYMKTGLVRIYGTKKHRKYRTRGAGPRQDSPRLECPSAIVSNLLYGALANAAATIASAISTSAAQ